MMVAVLPNDGRQHGQHGTRNGPRVARAHEQGTADVAPRASAPCRAIDEVTTCFRQGRGHDMGERKYRVAVMFAGDPSIRATVKLEETRFGGIAKALRDVGLDVEAASYVDEIADEVRAQLLGVDGVLVWVDPVRKDGNRAKLDPILRDVASHGVFVSSHPDLILKMGTKEVLYRTRTMSWGTDTRLYTTLEQFRRELPQCLAEGKPRVLKQYRGNGGNGVWKVEAVDLGGPRGRVRVRHAQRGSQEYEESLDEFVARCAQYFQGDGRVIDQIYQPRLTDGIVRCYHVRDRVAGFGEQLVNALYPAAAGAPPADAPPPGPRLYYPPTRPDFQKLKNQLESEWLPEMCCVLSIDPAELPVIWDADFMYGPKNAAGEDTYVLCEINISSVYPFPDEALAPLAEETLRRLRARARTH